jgi:hypothetical protein
VKEPLATLEEFSDRVPGSIDQADSARAQANLVDASALIRAEAGEEWDDGAPDSVKAICMAVAKRAFLNPDGINSMSVDGHSATFATGSPDVYLTAAERRAVRRAAGATSVWTLSTTRSEDDRPDTPAVQPDGEVLDAGPLSEFFE